MKKPEKDEQKNTYELRYLTRNDIRDLMKINMDVIIGNINDIMAERKITKMELSYAINSERCHVIRILTKQRKGITINVLGRISAALDVPISVLATPKTK